MSFKADLDLLTPLMDLLVDESDPLVRDRILLEAVESCGVAGAAQLWREAACEAGSHGAQTAGSAWMPLLSRGQLSALPSAEQLAAVADGELPQELPPARAVLISGEQPRRTALALGEISEDESKLDFLEAFFLALALTESSAPTESETRDGEINVEHMPSLASSALDKQLTHDLRNLLTCIRATQEVLEDCGDDLDEEDRESFHEAFDRECRRTSDFLIGAVTQAEAANESSSPNEGLRAPCASAGRVVGEVAREERADMRLAGVQLDVDVPDSLVLAGCKLPELDLSRVLLNLLQNARQALSNSPGENGDCHADRQRVLVRLRATEFEGHEGLLLAVQDNGPGFRGQDLARLFETGYGSSHDPERGRGLAVVRELSEKGGGWARASTGDEGGAHFEVWLPAA